MKYKVDERDTLIANTKVCYRHLKVQEKPLSGLVLGDFANALKKVADVGTFGAIKHEPSGWKTMEDNKDKIYDKLWRHLLDYASGQYYDVESGQSQLAHVAWNVLALLELEHE